MPPTLCRVGLRMDDRDIVVIRTQMSGRGRTKTNKQTKKEMRGCNGVVTCAQISAFFLRCTGPAESLSGTVTNVNEGKHDGNKNISPPLHKPPSRGASPHFVHKFGRVALRKEHLRL